jgi:MATE family multidrug resistance protein
VPVPAPFRSRSPGAAHVGSGRALRRAEGAALLRLAGPIVAAQMAWMGVGVTDTIVAGHAGPVALAGVTIGTSLFFPLVMFCTGTLMVVTAIVAQHDGAGRPGEAGETVRQGAWLSVAGLVLGAVVGALAPALLQALAVAPEIRPVAIAYLRVMLLGLPATLLFALLRYYCDGLSHTRPAMVVAVAALPVNALLDLVLVYGWLGAPRLGGVGCAIASAVVQWAQLAAMVALVRRPGPARGGLFRRFSPPRPQRMLALLRVGLPVGATTFFEMTLFALVTLLVGQFGPATTAAHQIAYNVNGITFMVPLALGMAASVRVGFNVGRGDYRAAEAAAGRALRFALVFAIAAAVVLLATRPWIPLIYSTDPEVVRIAAVLIAFVAGYQLVDDTQVTVIGALRGYKDTGAPMVMALSGYWLVAFPLGLAFAYVGVPLVGVAGQPLGVYGFWIGLTSGLGLVAVLVTLRLRWLARRHDRVAALARQAAAQPGPDAGEPVI